MKYRKKIDQLRRTLSTSKVPKAISTARKNASTDATGCAPIVMIFNIAAG